MRNTKPWQTTICSLLLTAGLFCAQACQVVCATAACAEAAQPAQPKPQAEHAHCHPQPPPAAPAPHHPSHDCQKHEVLQSLPPDTQLAKQHAQADWQPACITPFVWAQDELTHAALNTPAPTPFKPPPRQQHTTVQRI